MYIPSHFAINANEEAHRIIEAHPLGILVTSTEEGLDANHLPFELDAERGVLTAHVARANPVWKKCGEGIDALVTFSTGAAGLLATTFTCKTFLLIKAPEAKASAER